MTDFKWQPLFELGPDETPYRHLGSDGVSTVELDGREFLKVEPEALTASSAASAPSWAMPGSISPPSPSAVPNKAVTPSR